MKRSIVFLLLFVFSTVHAQDRKSGKAVVPIGYENLDSIRYGHFELSHVAYWMGPRPNDVDSVSDSAQCNYDVDFGGLD